MVTLHKPVPVCVPLWIGNDYKPIYLIKYSKTSFSCECTEVKWNGISSTAACDVTTCDEKCHQQVGN